MKPHCHIIPMGYSALWPYWVCHFDGNGKWCASSFYKTKDEARKAHKAAVRRYRRERKPKSRKAMAGLAEREMGDV
jgi:hypothetical protein